MERKIAEEQVNKMIFVIILSNSRNTEGWFPKSYIKLDSNNAPMPGIDGATSNGSEQRRVSGEKLVNGKNGVGYEVKEIMNATEMKKSDSIGKEGVPGEWFIVSPSIYKLFYFFCNRHFTNSTQ